MRLIRKFRELYSIPRYKKIFRYSLVSVISIVVSQISFITAFGILHMWGARGSSIFATAMGAIPSYYLNRTWAWGKSGRSHLTREVLPFWTLSFIGLAFSTWTADFAASHASIVGPSHALQVGFVSLSYLGGFGILWIFKFIIFNKLIFSHKKEKESESLSGTSNLS